MASKRVRPSKRSSNPDTTKGHPDRRPGGQRGRPRAHRDDTPEAREQQRRLPKTHPRRSPSAGRKDKTRKPDARTAGGHVM